MKNLFLVLLLALNFVYAQEDVHPQDPAAHDKGPNLEKKLEKKFIDIQAAGPYSPSLSEQIIRGYWKKVNGKDVYVPGQKMRVADGEIPMRGFTKKNSVKILFIGQDGVFISVLTGYPGGSGFGGRVQKMGRHFGIDYSLETMNAFATTIRGQASAFDAPFVYDGEIRKGTITPNDLWMFAYHPLSPLQEIRNQQIMNIMENNPDSLKLIVLFGGAARDSMGAFIESNGGSVGTRFNGDFSKLKVPEFSLQYAGGNNEFPVPFSREGDDLYQKILGEKLNYSNNNHKKKALSYIAKNDKEVINQMVFSHAGFQNTGLIHPAQMGGYNLDKISINGQPYSRSLKGMELKTGYKVKNDLLVAVWKHPTFLSRAEREAKLNYMKARILETVQGQALLESQGGVIKNIDSFIDQGLDALDKELASEIRSKGYEAGQIEVNKHLEPEMKILEHFRDKYGFSIEPDLDPNMQPYESPFLEKKDFYYGKEELPHSHYMPGMSHMKMANSANGTRGKYNLMVNGEMRRVGGNINIGGDRMRPALDKTRLEKMLLSKPNQMPTERYPLRTPTGRNSRYVFDRGFPYELYGVMKEYDFSELYKPKEGMSFKADGIKAYYIKSHPDHKDWGHARGKFKQPKVVILADPEGWDEFTTSRALTGTRGQYLQGMMDNLGVGDEYLVIKTVPFQMDGATKQEWDVVIDKTQQYRDNVFETLNGMMEQEPVLFLADGPQAEAEMKRILSPEQLKKFVAIKRRGNGRYRADNNSGMSQALEQIEKSLPEQFENLNKKVVMRNIPRTHLPQRAPVWWGTSGDTSLDSTGVKKGLVTAMITPLWALDKEPRLTAKEKKDAIKMRAYLRDNGFPLPEEKIPDFIKRTKAQCVDIYKPKMARSKRKIDDLDI